MAEKVQVETATVETNDALQKAKGFWAKFSKPIIYVGGAIIVLIAGWYGYKNFVVAPKEEKANEMVFAAENLFGKMAAASSFSKDSVNVVLNGGNLDGTVVTGLLKVISNYGGTASGNRAKYIAGACYLHLKEFDKAVKYLKDFDGNGADQVQSKAYILLGHAYAEQKKTDDAFGYYKKSAEVLSDKDEDQKAIALFNAANYAEWAGKSKDAIELLTNLKDNFGSVLERKGNPQYGIQPPPVSSADVEKLLAKLGVTK
jgi:predicted negative regulator of RcsB-dependent stress response